jgi:hypothetical protein
LSSGNSQITVEFEVGLAMKQQRLALECSKMRTPGNFVIFVLLFGTLLHVEVNGAAKPILRRTLGKLHRCNQQRDTIPANSTHKIKAFDYDFDTCLVQCLHLAKDKGEKRKCKAVAYCSGNPAKKCILYDQTIQCSKSVQFKKVDKKKKCSVWTT